MLEGLESAGELSSAFELVVEVPEVDVVLVVPLVGGRLDELSGVVIAFGVVVEEDGLLVVELLVVLSSDVDIWEAAVVEDCSLLGLVLARISLGAAPS